MATTDLVTKKINYTIDKKSALTQAVGLTGNPTWTQIIERADFYKNNVVDNVSNLSLSSGIVSWSAPDLTGLTSRDVSVSYLVYLNDTLIGTTTNTSFDVNPYMADGDNVIKVKCKVTINNTIYVSVAGVITYTYSISTTTRSIAISDIGTPDVHYAYGHYDNTLFAIYNTNFVRIYAYVKALAGFTQTYKTNEEQNPVSFAGCPYAQIGQYLYIFPNGINGHYKAIKWKMLTTSYTYSYLSDYPSTLVRPSTYDVAFAIGTNIYITVQDRVNNTNYLIKYDTLTDTYTQVTFTFDSSYAYGYNFLFQYNGNIYLSHNSYNESQNCKLYKINIDETNNTGTMTVVLDFYNEFLNELGATINGNASAIGGGSTPRLFKFDDTNDYFFIELRYYITTTSTNVIKYFKFYIATNTYEEVTFADAATSNREAEIFFYPTDDEYNVISVWFASSTIAYTRAKTLNEEE